MDQDNELARFKWLLFAGIMFLISGYYSISELRFAVSGKTIEASLTQVKQTMSTGRRSRPRLSFEYQFAEADGKTRSERDVVSVTGRHRQRAPSQFSTFPVSRTHRGCWVIQTWFGSMFSWGVRLRWPSQFTCCAEPPTNQFVVAPVLARRIDCFIVQLCIPDHRKRARHSAQPGNTTRKLSHESVSYVSGL